VRARGTYLLDTSALMALRDDEPGAEHVAELLGAAASQRTLVYACFMSQMELLYRVWRDESEAAGRLALEQCLALPIQWVESNPQLLRLAAEVKATSSLSVADAWIAAAARLVGASLVHKDPEFAALDQPQDVLPLKATSAPRKTK
jgi:predicted nucleic acid-binding protein